MKRFEPFNDYLVVDPREASSSLDTMGLVPVDSGRQHPNEGVVVAIGPNMQSGVQIGDHVFFTTFGGTDKVLNGKTVKMLRESELVGRLVDDTTGSLIPQPGESIG